MPVAAKAIVLAFVGLMFIVLPWLLPAIAALRAARLRITLEVSPRELRVVTKGILRETSAAIPADELEELQVIPAGQAPGTPSAKGHVLFARSDRAALAFGEGLSHDELTWLRAVVWNVVSA